MACREYVTERPNSGMDVAGCMPSLEQSAEAAGVSSHQQRMSEDFTCQFFWMSLGKLEREVCIPDTLGLRAESRRDSCLMSD